MKLLKRLGEVLKLVVKLLLDLSELLGGKGIEVDYIPYELAKGGGQISGCCSLRAGNKWEFVAYLSLADLTWWPLFPGM